MDNCVFCLILNREADASFVYQDEFCVAFLDIQPINPGHALVVPTEHVASLADLDDDISAHLMIVAKRLAAALYNSDLGPTGVNLLLADGESAGQDVFHVHLHVIPRAEEDGFGFKYAPGYWDLPTREDLESVARQLRKAIELQ